MIYNIFIQAFIGTFNIFGVSEDQLIKLITAYKNGEEDITLSGTKYFIKDISEFQIFTHETSSTTPEKLMDYCKYLNLVSGNSILGFYLAPNVLAKGGKNVTNQFIGDSEYGENKKSELTKTGTTDRCFVNKDRIKELKAVPNKDFDLSKLIRLCEELNDNFSRGNYLSAVIISRAILDHIPPIFGFKTFNDVASQYGVPSFKKNMSQLNSSMRSISDHYLHTTIRKKESLPNDTQVDFSQNLDMLLSEISRKLNEK